MAGGRRKKLRKPPYVGTLPVTWPDGTEGTIPLPPAADFELGARESLPVEYGSLKARVEVVRIPGGWKVQA